MFISELFYSIQGEGSLLGVPSVFIRTSGCNLRCRWCDTPYTSWQPEGSHLSLDAILDFVRRHSTGFSVITGGEPLIAPEIVPLTRLLRQAGEHITIETAGTVYAPVECDLMSISPKMSNSTPDGEWRDRHDRTRLNDSALELLLKNFSFQLKFVVASESDLPEILHFVHRWNVPPKQVLLMPEGTDPQTLTERARWLADVCKRLGFRLTPRLHVELFGNRRGV